MKRIHLFEFEDFRWFPSWIRDILTRYIVTMHRLLKSKQELLPLVKKGLAKADEPQIMDLCSGDGGPMVSLFDELKAEIPDLKLQLSDLYPNLKAITRLENVKGVNYIRHSVDATKVPDGSKGLRTLICSFHHLRPETATKVLQNAVDDKAPILVYEISDNAFPKILWWLSIPFTFISTLFIMPMVRPFNWKMFVFTYLIPILPLLIAWDGSVSNARTYTIKDMDKLIEGLDVKDYTFEKEVIKGKPSSKIYLLGYPN